MTYRREIDGLRAVAVLAVIFYHANLLGVGAGFIGVDVFFVISGYLISSLILKDLEKGTFSLWDFYERRARRILPALFLVMLCCIPFAWMWLMPLELTMFAKSLVAVCLFSSNFLFWKESGYFEPSNELKPLLHTWSLAVEEQFYLIFPLLFLLAWKWKRRGLFFLIFVVSVLSLGIMQWGSLNSPDANYYLLPGRAWEFLLGMLITLVIHPVQEKAERLPGIISEVAAVVGMVLLITSLFTFNKYEAFPSFFSFIPLAGTALIILFATSKTLMGKVLCSRPLVGIGLISYSGYLWHQPLFAFARHALLREPKPWIFGVLIVLNFILSYFSWKFLEQPFRSKQQFSKKQVFVFAKSFSTLVIALGTVGILQKGFAGRLKNTTVDFDQFFAEVKTQKIAGKFGAPIGRYYNHTINEFRDTDHFIEHWKALVLKRIEVEKPVLSVFGDSHAGNTSRALAMNGVVPLQMSGSNCAIAPKLMTEMCKKLAYALKETLRSTPTIRYLVLVRFFKEKCDLSLDEVSDAINFWRDLKLPIILFSDRPHFPYLKESLQRGSYPGPRFDSADWSLREELRDYLKSEGVHLVDAKEAFCRMTPHCTFKLGDRFSFAPEDMLLYDDHHLSLRGEKEFGRILIEIDPVFREMAKKRLKKEIE